ncbi:TATA-binding protein-associated factor mot1 [Asimina triloba]
MGSGAAAVASNKGDRPQGRLQLSTSKLVLEDVDLGARDLLLKTLYHLQGKEFDSEDLSPSQQKRTAAQSPSQQQYPSGMMNDRDQLRHCPPPANNPESPPTATAAAPNTNSFLLLLKNARNNLSLQSKCSELNGAMGDLGTYIPIVMALTLDKDLDLGTTLVFSGVYNILTGIIYGMPMPVQPMKAIAAAAISHGPDFGIPEIMAAGICTGGALFLLGSTGLMRFAYKFISLPVVRGVQLSQGLSFAMTAVKYVRNVQNFSAKKTSGEQRQWLGLDGLLLAIVCAGFIVAVSGAGLESDDEEDGDGDGILQGRKEPRGIRKVLVSLPSAFIVFLLGVVVAIARKPSAAWKGIELGPSHPKIVRISRQAWKDGFLKGAIPQIPLSVLNSVIAVCKLASDLFPEKGSSATSVSVSVGLMNLVGCWFGAMPCCHGAGGLAGQYKFGGRSGGCVAILGAAKLVLGLALGSSIVRILTQFPVGLLGILLLFAGIELAMAARDMSSKTESFVMLVCTVVSLVGSSAALGFGCGIVVHALLRLRNFSRNRAHNAALATGSGGRLASVFYGPNEARPPSHLHPPLSIRAANRPEAIHSSIANYFFFSIIVASFFFFDLQQINLSRD